MEKKKKNLEFSSFTIASLKSALNVAYKNRTHLKTSMKSSFRLNQTVQLSRQGV